MTKSIRHAAKAIALTGAVTIAALFGGSRQADAATAAQVRKALQARYWWADISRFGDRPFGYMYMFGTRKHSVAGWYVGQRVTFRGMVSAGTRLGFAWKPVNNGVLIDHGSSREFISIKTFNSRYEVLFVGGSFTKYWTTTRSPFTPASIRRYYYR